MLILNTLKGYVLKVFDIKEEELYKTLLLQLNIFLLISTLLIVKPTINSLFLSELTSDALPLGYVLTAIMAVIGSYFYDKILEKYPLNFVIERTLIGSVISLVIFGIAFNFNLGKGWLYWCWCYWRGDLWGIPYLPFNHLYQFSKFIVFCSFAFSVLFASYKTYLEE